MGRDERKYYLGDKNLPTGNVKQEYTPKMIKEITKCANNIFSFAKHFFIVTLDHGKQPIKLYRPQRRVLKSFVNNRFTIVLSPRQAGKTTLITIYALWYTSFNPDKTVLIVANKEDTAKEILSRIKMAYEQLPNWLKPGVEEWAKTEVKFSNDSRIRISTTSASAARGLSINCLFIDEMAHIQSHIIKEFWNSVIPVVSSSLTTKVMGLSTPNGTGNLFHKIYSGAERDDPDFSQWNHERMDWREIPSRGKKWERDMRNLLAAEGKSFDQEFNCVASDTEITIRKRGTNKGKTVKISNFYDDIF